MEDTDNKTASGRNGRKKTVLFFLLGDQGCLTRLFYSVVLHSAVASSPGSPSDSSPDSSPAGFFNTKRKEKEEGERGNSTKKPSRQERKG